MGIRSQLAIVLLREHRYRPIVGTLLSIGRQTVYLTPDEAIALVKHELGIEPRARADSLEIDTATRSAQGQAFITDRAFYSLFSDAEFRCLDVSDYEGADIVLNLCGSVSPDLEERFDFIIEGGCLDNIFDPAAAIRNLARLLKPGGRILHIDRASRRHNVYVAFALSWFHDYYAINGFEDCQVYLAQWDEGPSQARWDFYCYAPVQEQDGRIAYFGQDRWYYPWREAHAVVIAEKSQDSTWAKSPVQFEYRASTKVEEVDGRREIVHQTFPADADDAYVAASVRFHRSPRPPLLRPEEKAAIASEFLHYSAETVYCGSLFGIRDHLYGLGLSATATAVADLPALNAVGTDAARWDGIDGFALAEIAAPSVVEGQPVLKLVVTPGPGLHRVGIAFRGLAPNRTYRATAWIKIESRGWLTLDARDGATPGSRLASFDLEGAEGGTGRNGPYNFPSPDGWFCPSIDVHSADGELVAYACLGDGANSVNFNGNGRTEMTFGGMKVAPVDLPEISESNSGSAWSSG